MILTRALLIFWLFTLVALVTAPVTGHSQSSNIALGKPVAVSSFESDSYPEYAVDGDATLTHWWGANPYPQWLEIDRLSVSQLDQLHLFTYRGGNRYYQYTIEVSVDGEGWTQVVDMSTNSQPATAMGYEHSFPASAARYIRVNTTGNSWFPDGRFPRIVEVLARKAP